MAAIKLKVGDVVRVYRHPLKDCIGLVGTVCFIGKVTIGINILGIGRYLVNKSSLAHA